MGRPRLGLGTPGKIKTTPIASGWQAKCQFRDYDGVTRPVKRNGPTKRAAEQALKDALLERQHRGTGELTRDHTFAEAGEGWLEELRRRRRGSTYDRYRTRLRNQVNTALGSLALHECTTMIVNRYFNVLQDRGLRAETVRGYRNVVSGVMDHAVRMGALRVNPCRGVLPIEGKPKESRGLTFDERVDLLSKVDADQRAQGDDLPDLLRLLLGTGMRIGEALALRWFRVDLDEGVRVVGDTLVRETLLCADCGRGRREHPAPDCLRFDRAPGRGLLLHEPKTEAGFRVLPLPDFVSMMLRLRYPGDRFGLAPVFPRCIYGARRDRFDHGGRGVLEYREGAWRDPNNTMRSIRKFREDAGYDWFTSHACRHTAITICSQAQLEVREISGYHGHARPSFTQDKYLDRRQQSGAIPRALDSALRPLR